MPGNSKRKKNHTQSGSMQPKKRPILNRKLEHEGTICKIIEDKSIGFLRPHNSLPNGDVENEGKNVFFHFDRVSSGGLKLMRNDTIRFSLGLIQRDSKGPSIFRGVLLKGVKRNEGQVKEFLDEVERVLDCKSNDAGSDAMIAVLNCPVAWACIADCCIGEKNICQLIGIISKMDSKLRYMNEYVKEIVDAIAHSKILSKKDHPFKDCIGSINSPFVNSQEMLLFDRMKELFVIILKHVPEKGRSIVQLIEPLCSTNAAQLCFDLLKIMSSHANVSSVEDLKWEEIPLVLANDELHQDQATSMSQIKPIKKTGSYGSAAEYLEILFRLLREDCFHSLKKGIKDLLNNTLDKRDMNVYYDVHLVGIHVSRSNGLCLALKFRTREKVDWKKSKKLMFGNLLCLSVSRKFDDVIHTTVVSREYLQSGQTVLVELCNAINSLGNFKAIQYLSALQGGVIAAESPTYYRAYAPILETLQKLDPESISFKEELVNLCQQGPPDHLHSHHTFDWSTIFKENLHYKDPQLNLKYLLNGRCNPHLIFDESQNKAVAQTLKQRIGIIQGPPGTGKSFIGMKLTQLLLSLSSRPAGPILVLTYKNHALDEFLKALVESGCENVVRIGGGSKDPILGRYNLNVVEKDVKKSEVLHQEMGRIAGEFDEADADVKEAFDVLMEAARFSVDAFVSFLNETQLSVFVNNCPWRFPLMMSGRRFTTLKEVCHFTQQLDFKQLKSGLHVDWMSEILKKAFDIWCPPVEYIAQFERNMSTVLNWMSHNSEFISEANEGGDDEESEDEDEVEDLLRNRQSATNDLNIQLNSDSFLSFDAKGKGNSPKLFNCASKILQNTSPTFFHNIADVWKVTLEDRIKLMQFIMSGNYEKASDNFAEKIVALEVKRSAYNSLRNQHKANVLKTKDVVAMTITGASINYDLLQQLKPSIVIVEEAAELLEAQLVAALGSWTKQLILIGDHKQLRPTVESYELERNYNMDISLMERLILNGFSFSTLQKQNRMRPEFAELLMDIYPDLQSNLERVGSNEKATCLEESAYFWHHEDKETNARSFWNDKEADRAVRLAMFLIQQGTRPCKITILSAYQGQTGLVRKKLKHVEKQLGLKSDEKDNKVITHTIDNYQGDENDFVIISLVRSNEKKSIGFLKLQNRRCVAQSRSKCGLYFIGNCNMFSSSPSWAPLLNKMQTNGQLLRAITLVCPRHPNSKKRAFSANDIDLGAFCQETCDVKLECGHLCKKVCQPPHSHDKCSQTCTSVCQSCHLACEKKCRPIHNHDACDRKIKKTLFCGHQADLPCNQNPTIALCTKMIPFIAKKCGHTGKRLCYQGEEDVHCEAPCPVEFSCGHLCQKKCGEKCMPEKCSRCEEIKLAEAKKMEEMEKKMRKLRVDEEKKLIEELKKKESNEPTRVEISKTGDTADEYLTNEDRVMKYIQPSHKWYPLVTKIEKVTNYRLEKEWRQAKCLMNDPEFRSELKFHGTSTEAVDSIIKEGFRIPQKATMFGKGIYFATDSSKSAQEMYTKGSNTLLLCDVLLGKTLSVDKARNDMTAQKLGASGYDSLFAKRDTRQQGGVLYDEYVVYNKAHALPKYIIHYQRESVIKQIALPSLAAGKNDKIEKFALKPSRSVDTNDPRDIHYRVAESQFLRLMSTTGKKRKIESIEFYSNPPLERKFDARKKQFEASYTNSDAYKSQCIFAFHGTKPSSVKGIMEENFRIDLLSQNTGNPGQYGAGIYFSELPEICEGYGDSLILCKVLPGNSVDVTKHDMKGKPLVNGFDSHGAHPTREKQFKILVIFDKDQILPCYVIKSKKIE